MHATRRDFSAAALLLPAAVLLPASVLKRDAAAAGMAGIDGPVTIPLADVDAAVLPGNGSLLLVRDEFSGRWTSLGSIGAERGEWLRELV